MKALTKKECTQEADEGRLIEKMKKRKEFHLMYFVNISVPPSVSSSPSDAVRVLGQSITFQCGFHGNPPPRIEWYHGNSSKFSPVPSIPKYITTGGTLRITSISIEDEGTFLCKGINVAGTANATAYLNVQG